MSYYLYVHMYMCMCMHMYMDVGDVCASETAIQQYMDYVSIVNGSMHYSCLL